MEFKKFNLFFQKGGNRELTKQSKKDMEEVCEHSRKNGY